MATKKKKASKSTSAKSRTKTPPRPEQSAAYEAMLKDFAAALQQLRRGDYKQALDAFKQVEADSKSEQEVAARARTYAAVCARKLAPPSEEPKTSEERYYLAVFLANSGELKQALELLNRSLSEDPTSASLFYVRSSVRALQGNTEAAVADLRQAIALDPTVRYQATNDPDFERVRDDAAFIDVIEPTAAGV